MSTLWIAIIVLSVLSFLFGLILGYSAQRFQVAQDPIAEKINDILPQSQCGQCGYPGCRPYAQAVANGEMINKCTPGGSRVMIKLSELLNLAPQKLGSNVSDEPIKKVAYINEDSCIGCTKCIKACPVDAIIGSTRSMHTVISDFCTGCNLCVSPCPTDCIEMRVISTTPGNWPLD